ELSRTADVVGAALNDLTGATSPRLHLELMIARVLVTSGDDTERGTLARVERLERRVGVAGGASPSTPANHAVPDASTTPPTQASARAAAPQPPVPTPSAEPAAAQPAPASAPAEPTPAPAAAPGTPVTFEQLSNAWPQVLEAVEKVKRNAWT